MMAQSVEPSSPPRTSFQLIGDRNFGVLFWGKIASLMAVWAYTIVVILLTYDATGSTTWVGVVGAVQLAPQLVLALASGRLADTYGPLLQIIAGGMFQGLSAIGLAVWLHAAGAASGPAAAVPLLIASFVLGCGLALSAPAMQSLVPRIVRQGELSSAVALNFLPTALARTIGPAVGAVLAATSGSVAGLAVVGAVFVASSLWFTLIESPRPPASERDPDARIVSALRYVRGDRGLLALLAGVAAIGAGAEPAITLAPALAESVGHASEGGGWALSAFGGGGMLGVIAHRYLSRWLRPVAEGCAAMVALGAAMAIAAFAGSLVQLSLILAVAGVSMVVGSTAFSVAIQERCRPMMLGRVMGLWLIAFAGVRPVAGLVQGSISDGWSTEAALGVTASFMVLTACWVFAVAHRIRARTGA